MARELWSVPNAPPTAHMWSMPNCSLWHIMPTAWGQLSPPPNVYALFPLDSIGSRHRQPTFSAQQKAPCQCWEGKLLFHFYSRELSVFLLQLWYKWWWQEVVAVGQCVVSSKLYKLHKHIHCLYITYIRECKHHSVRKLGTTETIHKPYKRM